MNSEKTSIPRDLEERTCACREALMRFGRESDNQFTALAKGVSDLNRRLSELRAKAEHLDLILRDEDQERAISSAYLLYKNALDLVHSSVGIALAEQKQMNEISGTLLKACRTQDVFQRNHLMLRILTLNMRMEAVRLDSEGQSTFLTIAAGVADIDQKIVASTHAAFERIESVIRESTFSHEQSNDLEQGLHRCAQESVERIQRELDSLKAALAPCVHQSREIVDLIAQTAPRTMQVIGSLQHQDIVRQQLEHVSAGFDELQQHLHKLEADGRVDPAEAAYVHRAAAVQKAHLNASRQEIASASADVSGGLRALLEVSNPLLERFLALDESANAAFSDSHVAEIFAAEVKQLVRISDQSEAANDKSSRLVERIEEIVRVFSQEIAGYELDVKIVALNAQIASAQMPAADALSRIAQETGSVADENAAVTRELTQDLRGCLESLTRVKKSSVEFVAIAAKEKRDLENSVLLVSEKLRKLGARIKADVASVRREIDITQQENQALLERVHLTRLIEECYTPAEQLCTHLLDTTAAAAADTPLSADAASRLEQHRSRYTMQKENATHLAALGASTTAADAAHEPELFTSDTAPSTTTSEIAAASAASSVTVDPHGISLRDNSKPGAPPSASSDSATFGDGVELF